MSEMLEIQYFGYFRFTAGDMQNVVNHLNGTIQMERETIQLRVVNR